MNKDTLRDVIAERRNLWEEARELRYRAIILSPEQLKTIEFRRVRDDEAFREVCGITSSATRLTC